MNFLKTKKSRMIAAIMATSVAVSSFAVGLTAAFASKPDKVERLVQPNGYSVVKADGDTTISVSNAVTVSSSDKSIVTVTIKDNRLLTVTGIKAGIAAIGYGNKVGGALTEPVQVVNADAITGYNLPNGGNGYVKEPRSAALSASELGIKYYKTDAPARSDTGTRTPSEKALNANESNYKRDDSLASDVEWSSVNPEVVNENMVPVGKGVTILVGAFTDRWGVKQTIYYLFGVGIVPGDSAMNDLLDAINKGKEILDDAGKPGNEDKYDQDKLDYLQDMVDKGEITLNDPAADEQKISDDTKDIWDAINDMTGGSEGGLGDGVVQVGDDYYRPVPDAPGVWEKTDSTGTESTGEYFGGNEELPNVYEPLYKIQPEDNERIPPADNYSDKYPGYLTTKPKDSCEYDRWQKAINEKISPTDSIPTGVSGRILSEEQAGDSSTWIEIAQNGSYSLILRSNCEKPNSLFNSTLNSRYSGSLLESRMDAFYTNLPVDSGLKKYAVMSNAVSRIVTSHDSASLNNINAFSVPSGDKPSAASGVAFAPSYQELALFCSLKNYSGTSPASARSNFTLLKTIGDVDLTESMTRSPFGTGYLNFIQLTSIFYGTPAFDGYFHDDAANLDFAAGIWSQQSYGKGWGIRPAMWVDSSIFN